MAGLGITVPALLASLILIVLHHEVCAQVGPHATVNTTCYHCYWVDVYGNDTTGPGFPPIDMLQGEGANTSNCQNNLDLVPTIQCAGDCFTHEFTTSPHSNADEGFIHYIARTCSVEENPFISSSVSVQPNTCVDGRDYYNSEDKQGSLCRCSGDLCNNREVQELTTTKCYVCSVNIVNGTITRDYRPGYNLTDGPPTGSCVTPESGLIPAIECPSDCYVTYKIFTAVFTDVNETNERIQRGCHSDYYNDVSTNSCYDVEVKQEAAPGPGEPEIIYDVNNYCRCSGDECDPKKITEGPSGTATIRASLLFTVAAFVMVAIFRQS